MEFPEEVFVNILVRLPIKDIFRFKVVCKSWLNLISDPYFTRCYARNSPYSVLFRVHEYCRDSENSFSLLEFSEKGEITQIPFSPKLGPYTSTTVIGSWDSSVFLLHCRWFPHHATDRIYLFNPFLGSCFEVTQVYRPGTHYQRFHMEYKVGYIPSNSTYKLFRYNVDTDSYKKDAAKVLTVGLDKNWRNMDKSLCRFLFKQVLCLNGAFHWVSEEGDGMVCTYDLLEEKNGAGIPIPHGVSLRISLTILDNGCLSVIDQLDDDTMVIWTMKEYGVVESWSKVTVLTFRNPYPKFENEPYFLPVAVFPNGNILFTKKRCIFIFCLEEKQLREIKCPDPLQHSCTLYVNTYAPRFYTLEVGTKIGG